MSNIFEAVKKGNGGIAESIRPLTDGTIRISAPEAKADNNVHNGAAASHQNGAAAASESLPAGIRSVSLRIPAPSPIFPFDGGNLQASEQYRILRAKLVQHPRQPRVIVISSPAARDGKSISAINLAGAMSLKEDARVLLVDGDMRRPSMHMNLGIPKEPGLADVLMGRCSLEEAVVQTQEFPQLFVITAGTSTENPAELLERGEWPALCNRLRNLFRYTVIDSPPFGAVADFDLIRAGCDGVILVVRPDQTNRQLCRKALETVPRDKFLGVVMNCVPGSWLNRQSSYYYYSDAKTD